MPSFADGVGREVPAKCRALWARRAEPKEMQKRISNLRCELQALQDKADPLYAPVNFSHAVAHLTQAYESLRVAIPFAVCPYCHGEGCRICGTSGMVSRFLWDHACAEEFKEAAITQGALQLANAAALAAESANN